MRTADWAGDHEALVALRTRVFVDEQRVPLEIELDGLDADCVHVAAECGDGSVVGTGRLLPGGRIGRMAVDPDWRGRGIGRALLDALVERAREQGLAGVELHAQTRAEGFYEAAGFRALGPVFEEAGIPHRRMWLDLRAAPPGATPEDEHA